MQPNEFKIIASGNLNQYMDMAFEILECGQFKHLKITARGKKANNKAARVIEEIYEHGPLCQITEKYIPVFNPNGDLIQEGHYLISLLDSLPNSAKNAAPPAKQ